MADVAGAYGWAHEDIWDMDAHWFFHYLSCVGRVMAQRELTMYRATMPFYMEREDATRTVRDMERRARGEAKKTVGVALTEDDRRRIETETDAGLQAAGLMPFVGQFITNR